MVISGEKVIFNTNHATGGVVKALWLGGFRVRWLAGRHWIGPRTATAESVVNDAHNSTMIVVHDEEALAGRS